MVRQPVIALLILLYSTGPTYAQNTENLIVNGAFSVDSDEDGMADSWRFEPGTGEMEAGYTIATGPDGSPCQEIHCTKYWGTRPGRCHVMLAQRATISLTLGHWYRVRFHARAEGIEGGIVTVGVQDSSDWSPAVSGLPVAVGPDWQRAELVFRSQKTVSESSRFQISFSEVGTLRIDNVELVEIPAPPVRTRVVSWPENVSNPLLNPDFDAGLFGWGSWNGGRILATEDTGSAASGLYCAHLVSSPTATPTLYGDLHATVAPAPVTLVSLGLVPLVTDQVYTLSAWLKTNRPNVRALLGLTGTRWRRASRVVNVSTEWTREHVSLSPQKPYGSVFIQLAPSEPLTAETSLWIDGVQLERGPEAHPFQCRSTIELGAEPSPPDGIALEGEPLRVRVRAVNYQQAAWKGNLYVKVTDYFDREVFREERPLTLGPKGQREELLEMPESLGNGFFRFWYGLEEAFDNLHTLRLARIKAYDGESYRFGLNHVYTYPSWQKRAIQGGIGWGRAWSYSWPNVEPEQGLWNFGGPDRQRAYTHQTGMSFLALLPYSSCNWSNTAPPDARPYLPPRYPRDRVGHRPASIGHWNSYIEEIARHLRDRVSVFEILNEPLWTEYALRPEGDYGMEDYAELLRSAFRTLRRLAPTAKVIGGLSAFPREHAVLHAQFLATDAIRNLDIFSIHDYPPDMSARINESAFERLARDLRDRAGKAVPMWLTEFGYYADDDNDLDVFPEVAIRSWAASHAVKSERRAADLTVQYNVIAAAYGVQKVFYHVNGGRAGIPNCDGGDDMFFEWDGAPRKIYAAQAALADLLRPETTFVERLDLGPDGSLPFYVFESPQRAVAFVWTDDGQRATVERPLESDFAFRNVVGNMVTDATVSIDQSPIAVLTEKDASALSAWLVDTVSPTVRIRGSE